MYERDIRLLVEKGNAIVSEIRLIRILHKERGKDKSCYNLEFTLMADGSENETVLITSKNEPRTYIDLNLAVNFVEQLFPNNTEIKLVVR